MIALTMILTMSHRWDPGMRLFEVLLGDTGKPKMVKRLNLRLKDEDPALFDRRVAEAKRGREAAEAELR